ncbi:MAG: hypothetical protein ACYCS8_16315 [Acidithiobacillus sp.]
MAPFVEIIHQKSSSEKIGKLSAEIARLMREGTAESRKKAQDLLQAAIGDPDKKGEIR